MDIILFGDIFDNVLMPMLLPINLYNLARTCKQCQKKIRISHIKKSAIGEINRRLYEIFKDELRGFKEAMRETNATISGSFIIQCILGEHWEGSDVDVYIDAEMFDDFFYPGRCPPDLSYCDFISSDGSDTENKFIVTDTDNNDHYCEKQINESSELSESSELREYDGTCASFLFGNEPIKKQGLELLSKSNNSRVNNKNMLSYMYKKEYYVEKIQKDYHGNPGTVIDFRINGTRIQMIGESQKNLFTIAGYDFNICKNTYRYDDIFDGPTNLCIYRINEIFAKYTNFTAQRNLKKNIKRYLKYRDRGFEFYLHNKENKITDRNVLGCFDIDIIKIVPVNKSYDECRSMMLSNNYEFTYVQDGIYYKEISFGRPGKYSRKNKIFKIENEEIKFRNTVTKPCRGFTKCLFDRAYPNISHFHVSLYKSKTECSAILVLNDIDIELSR